MSRFSSIVEAVTEVSRSESPDGWVVVIFSDGSKHSYQSDMSEEEWVDGNGQLHREDGPAAVYGHIGMKQWYKHGKFHNMSGPALIDGRSKSVAYAINGKTMSREEFLRHADDDPKYKNWKDNPILLSY